MLSASYGNFLRGGNEFAWILPSVIPGKLQFVYSGTAIAVLGIQVRVANDEVEEAMEEDECGEYRQPEEDFVVEDHQVTNDRERGMHGGLLRGVGFIMLEGGNLTRPLSGIKARIVIFLTFRNGIHAWQKWGGF
jgi:hypothetical protein